MLYYVKEVKLIMKSKIIFIILFSLILFPVFAEQEVFVVLNGKNMEFDVSPQIINDRTMIPMRKIFEELGAAVLWDDITQIITANDGNNTIIMQIGSHTISVNGNEIIMDTTPLILNERTLVPLRIVSESLNAEVKWDSINKTCYISTTKNEQADGWFFYGDADDNFNLYKIDSNGNNKQKLTEIDCLNPRYIDGRIYFVSWSQWKGLFSIDINGEDLRQFTVGDTSLKAVDNGWVYYTLYPEDRPSPWPSGFGNLYRIRTDGTDNQLITDKLVSAVRISGEMLLFTGLPEWSPSILFICNLYKMKPDGTNEELITNSKNNPSLAFTDLYDGFAYWKNREHLFKIDLENGTFEQISAFDDISQFKIKGDKIYYTTKNDILESMDLNFENKTVIAENADSIFDITDNCILFSRPASYELIIDKFYSCNLDTKEEIELFEAHGASLHGDRIYYNTSYEFEDGGEAKYTDLYSIKTVGTDKKQIISEDMRQYNIIGDYIYFFIMGNPAMFRCDLDGQNKIMITETNSEHNIFINKNIID